MKKAVSKGIPFDTAFCLNKWYHFLHNMSRNIQNLCKKTHKLLRFKRYTF